MLSSIINPKLWISLQVFPYGSLQVVARAAAPGPVGAHFGRHFMSNRAVVAAVTFHAGEWGEGINSS